MRTVVLVVTGLVSSVMTQAQEGSSVERLSVLADLVVLGKITVTDPLMLDGTNSTRHTMKVESYYKGSGPTEISILTPGGYWVRKEGDKETKMGTQFVGSMGVQVGEEMLAFLRLDPNSGKGYVFAFYDYGAKCRVELDAAGERYVELRLAKKRYMRGFALDGFKEMEKRETGPNPTAAVESKLASGNCLREKVNVRDLRGRLEEILSGEQVKKPGEKSGT
ncbi:MAG TPA: hypothetical protein VGS03_03170 [Candidatus Polarisedimenticolia bacterium]|jgi:hypothetical protein|nr:hypothetical protein [Candidatus Polarisedimenticolia bacterium]